jgi:hypothetical protein
VIKLVYINCISKLYLFLFFTRRLTMSNLAVVLLRTIFVFSACVAVMSGKFLHQKRAIINDERRDLVNIDTRSDKAIRGTPTYCRCASTYLNYLNIFWGKITYKLSFHNTIKDRIQKQA